MNQSSARGITLASIMDYYTTGERRTVGDPKEMGEKLQIKTAVNDDASTSKNLDQTRLDEITISLVSLVRSDNILGMFHL